MKVTEKTERTVEIEFDDSEIAALKRIEETFGLGPREVVEQALTECIRTADSKIANYESDAGVEAEL